MEGIVKEKQENPSASVGWFSGEPSDPCRAMSMPVCGGGMRTGQIFGATNVRGEHPVECQLSPNDLWVTAYQHLGMDYGERFPDLQGRPMPILPFSSPNGDILPGR